MALAESAAIAAHISLREKKALHYLPYATLRAELDAAGQVVHL